MTMDDYISTYNGYQVDTFVKYTNNLRCSVIIKGSVNSTIVITKPDNTTETVINSDSGIYVYYPIMYGVYTISENGVVIEESLLINKVSKYTVEAPIMLIEQPLDFTGSIGDTFTLTTRASVDGCNYLWQYYNTTNNSWVFASGLSGYQTTTATGTLTTARINVSYRCKVTLGSYTIYSNSVTLYENI